MSKRTTVIVQIQLRGNPAKKIEPETIYLNDESSERYALETATQLINIWRMGNEQRKHDVEWVKFHLRSLSSPAAPEPLTETPTLF